MKKVLISDNYPLFRDFLKQKLSEEQIEIITTQENRDLYTKLITNLPNLLILDLSDDDSLDMEFLQKKLSDSNTANIPIIITGPQKDRSAIASLAKYGVIKYFEKPVQFDLLFKSIGNTIHTPIPIDTTPCVLDLHRNNKVIFIELALGLNREKLSLMRFKLSEMIESEKIENPKIVIMLTNLELSFVDGYNLEFLIDNVLSCPRVHNKNVKILSLSPFVKELLDGHPDYSEIEMSNNLSRVLNDLVDTSLSTNIPDIITSQILTKTDIEKMDKDSMATRFSSDSIDKSIKKNTGTVLNVAIIDSDESTLEISKNSFEQVGAICQCFTKGKQFIENYAEGKFDLIVLDVLLEDKTGLSLLQVLQKRPHSPPVIVYSQSLQKEIVVKVLSIGAKSYIVKPQKPNILVKKALAVLKN
ncbi:MAG: response regulator [Treponema sp.]|nr:response regulator [Spirochaetales bacterium]MDY5918980.1 response regulator [Treponema sp.]MDY6190433.1 response regulator [Treponema sp.]